mmetsp:Transcript_72470/g.135394  ORF Transcript_72470/g.135394 Transcript_72470/m.135394 type:complete len:98 (-) Transcript_72470:908-1201(-)
MRPQWMHKQHGSATNHSGRQDSLGWGQGFDMSYGWEDTSCMLSCSKCREKGVAWFKARSRSLPVEEILLPHWTSSMCNEALAHQNQLGASRNGNQCL